MPPDGILYRYAVLPCQGMEAANAATYTYVTLRSTSLLRRRDSIQEINLFGRVVTFANYL